MVQERKEKAKRPELHEALVKFNSAVFNLHQSSYVNKHEAFWGKATSNQSLKSIQLIVDGVDEDAKRRLSQEFFLKNGFYRQIVSYYATLLNNSGVLIPNPSPGTSLQEKTVAKRYDGALRVLRKMNLATRLRSWTTSVLVNGVYRGLVHTVSKKEVIVIDLPLEFTRVQYWDKEGNPLIEFDLSYFSRIRDKNAKIAALNSYPDFISNYFNAWENDGRLSQWLLLPYELTIQLELVDQVPFFLPLIPITLQYDDAVEREAEKERENIKKILVNEMPHLNDGSLVFEPDEVAVMHEGAVKMMSTDDNISVMTTYGKASIVQSNTQSSITHTALDQMSKHLYSSAGVSSQIFAPTSASALGTSVQYDLSVMMILADKMSKVISRLIDKAQGNSRVGFSYKILPVSEYNKEKYVAQTLKLAQSGYSFILPAIAMGTSQEELMDLKALEEALDLLEVLKPLQTSHTQSGKEDDDKGGRPKLDLEDKSDKTIENIEAGGSE